MYYPDILRMAVSPYYTRFSLAEIPDNALPEQPSYRGAIARMTLILSQHSLFNFLLRFTNIVVINF